MSDHKYDGRKHEPPYETESDAYSRGVSDTEAQWQSYAESKIAEHLGVKPEEFYQRGVRDTEARYARLVEAAEEIVTRPQATLGDIVLERSLWVDIDVLRAALDALEEMKK